MKKHTNLLREIYHGKKPSIDWYDTLIAVVVIIAVCYVILNVVTLIEVAGLIN